MCIVVFYAWIYVLQIQCMVLINRKRKRTAKNIAICARAGLPKEKWCRACVRKRSADMCVRRKGKSSDTEASPTMQKRKSFARDFFADFASADKLADLDEDLDTDISFLYPWCPTVAQGGTRRSPRLLWKEAHPMSFRLPKILSRN